MSDGPRQANGRPGGGARGSITDNGITNPHHQTDRDQLVEIIGVGGMSEVHHAREMRLQSDVAVKVLGADLAPAPSF